MRIAIHNPTGMYRYRLAGRADTSHGTATALAWPAISRMPCFVSAWPALLEFVCLSLSSRWLSTNNFPSAARSSVLNPSSPAVLLRVTYSAAVCTCSVRDCEETRYPSGATGPSADSRQKTRAAGALDVGLQLRWRVAIATRCWVILESIVPSLIGQRFRDWPAFGEVRPTTSAGGPAGIAHNLGSAWNAAYRYAVSGNRRLCRSGNPPLRGDPQRQVHFLVGHTDVGMHRSVTAPPALYPDRLASKMALRPLLARQRKYSGRRHHLAPVSAPR